MTPTGLLADVGICLFCLRRALGRRYRRIAPESVLMVLVPVVWLRSEDG